VPKGVLFEVVMAEELAVWGLRMGEGRFLTGALVRSSSLVMPDVGLDEAVVGLGCAIGGWYHVRLIEESVQ